jgi:hypothetical protein
MNLAVCSMPEGDHGSVRTIAVAQFEVERTVGYSVLCHFITSEGFWQRKGFQCTEECCMASSILIRLASNK